MTGITPLVAAIASAVLPGLGQLLQRRYSIGTLQLVFAVVFAVWWWLEGGMRFALEAWSFRGTVNPFTAWPRGWWLAMVGLTVVAAWSVVDAALAKRARRE